MRSANLANPGPSRKHVISDLPRDNDNDGPDGLLLDLGQGRAALLLVESLVHHLVQRSVLSLGEAIEIVDIAAEVEIETALTAADGGAVPIGSMSLTAISNSLRFDLEE